MRYEKNITREDGTQYQIMVSPYLDSYRNEGIQYRVDLWYREKGKRKWLNVPDTKYDYELRQLSFDEKKKHNQENFLRFVTEQEIFDAKIESWELLKPKK